VARDNTIRFAGHTLQLLPDLDRRSYSGAHVEVQERVDGSLVACYQGQVLATREAPPGPALLRARNSMRAPGRSSPGTDPLMQMTLLRNGVHHPEESGRVPYPLRQSPQTGLSARQAGQNPVRPRPAPYHPWRRPLLTKSLNN
jgi:hypothetical protein